MAARKAPAKASGVAQTDRTSTTRGKTFQEVTAGDGAEQNTDQPAPAAEPASGDQAKGYYGDAPDPTPNEHYTLAGVLSDKPVPETDR